MSEHNSPYASFRFNGEVMNLNEHQFKQAVRDGRVCRCGKCLCCRALEYHEENRRRTYHD